jgi:hypothetical protein
MSVAAAAFQPVDDEIPDFGKADRRSVRPDATRKRSCGREARQIHLMAGHALDVVDWLVERVARLYIVSCRDKELVATTCAPGTGGYRNGRKH